MKSRRVSRGFARLALVLVAPCAVSAIIATGIWGYTLATLPKDVRIVYGPDNSTFEFPAGTMLAEQQAALERHYGRSLIDSDFYGRSSQMWERQAADNAGFWALGSIALAALLWVGIRAVGWVLSGFFDD